MKVQRIRLPETQHVSWLVLDDQYLLIEPVCQFLRFREDCGRSPNTIQADAHHLKLFWEFLRDEHLLWSDIDIAQLAAFIRWLRRPEPQVVPIADAPSRRTNATIDQILSAVHTFYDFHMRLKTVPDLPLYRLLSAPSRRYKPFLYGIAKLNPIRSRVVKVQREQHQVKSLTHAQVQALIDACAHVRDRFLVSLLYDTGMRIGQALGLRHEDIQIEDQAIRIVPRDDNTNGARAKTREAYTIPASTQVLELYVRYLIDDLRALEADAIPDYVFVNLWDGEVGKPMTYQAVRSLFRRLSHACGVDVMPHLLRHTRATHWIRDDALPLATVSQLLGHASIETTHATYVHLTVQDLRDALNGKGAESR